MVEAEPQGDGIARPVQYAKWRTDKQPSPGYSAELISNRVDPQYYDDLGAQPGEPEDTLLKCFQKNVRAFRDRPFLGTRKEIYDSNKKRAYGDYEWKSFSQVDEMTQNLAQSLMRESLCPAIEGEDKMWNFLGIWAKNRAEWTVSILACMYQNITTVGFYDAMSAEQVDFILNQTEMTTIVCTADYAQKLLTLRDGGKAQYLKNLVVMDEFYPSLEDDARKHSIRVLEFQKLILPSQGDKIAFAEPTKDDVYIFSYTSGTTGDSKGVKLTHNNILTAARCTRARIQMAPGDPIISYLPYTHSFEQILLAFSLVQQLRIGFFSGDPLRLIEDCSKLRPAFFPSVPRLYNRIYSRIKGKFDAATGCKKWLVNKAMSTKQASYERDGSYTNGCYDKLVFKKVKALLGGQVRIMVTGSAPIDKTVIDYLKICFCCPILEGYGLTESSAATTVMDVNDAVTGHVGGPSEAVKIRLKDLPEMEYLSTDKPYPRGEICMYGPQIFSGYYKRPDKTAEAFDEEGWFKTGDVGQIYPNGSIKIIDRSKNIFKLSQGEYIAPEKIEQCFTLSQMVAQCFVYGDSFKNCCVCVIVPEEEWLKAFIEKSGGTWVSMEQACQNTSAKQEILTDLLSLAKDKKLSSLEKPKEFILWHDQFTIENDLITSTFKLKRNVAAKVFKPQIDQMYDLVQNAEAQARGTQR